MPASPASQIQRATRAIKIRMAQWEAITLGPYQDGTHLSIGLGHNNPKLKKRDRITVRRAFELFAEDLLPREQNIARLLKKDIPQHLFDMLVSLHYQSGNRYMPAVVHLINYGEMGALEALYPHCAYTAPSDKDLDGDIDPGEWRDGLHERRKQEWKIGTTGDYGDLDAPIKLWRGPPVGKSEAYTLQPGDID
jgi:GH24 family phage-related lysozyme (muramidase)